MHNSNDKPTAPKEKSTFPDDNRAGNPAFVRDAQVNDSHRGIFENKGRLALGIVLNFYFMPAPYLRNRLGNGLFGRPTAGDSSQTHGTLKLILGKNS